MIIYVPLSQIRDNPFQTRTEYGEIEELAADILRHKETRPDTLGLQQVPNGRVVDADDGLPVPVANLDDHEWLDGDHLAAGLDAQLEFGHRRLRAFQWLAQNGRAEYTKLPIFIRDLTNDDMLNGVWSENRARRDLSAVEEAELLKIKVEQAGDQTTAAKQWGLARSTVTNRLRLLDLPAEIQTANRNGRLSERQALALATAVGIKEAVGGTKWGDHIGGGWGIPAGPDRLIQQAIEKPNTITSDVIRDHTKAMVKYAGTEVPDAIAKHKFELDDIEQAQCKGCPFRINQSCLKKACAERKMAAWPQIALAEFSQRTGIPISDNIKYFDRPRDELLAIEEMFDNDTNDGGLVCGWIIDEATARPFGRGYYVSRFTHFEENGQRGIALGYKGRLPGVAGKTAVDEDLPYEMPTAEQVEAWRIEAGRIADNLRESVRGALLEKLSQQIADDTIIRALMLDLSDDRIDDHDTVMEHLLEHLLRVGAAIRPVSSRLKSFEQWQRLAQLAKIETPIVDNGIQETAILLLANWYSNCDSHWDWERNSAATECQPQIQQWREAHAASGLGLDIAAHIDRAAVHIDHVLKELEEEE